MNRTTPTSAEIKLWCAALRSGEYEQGRGALQWNNSFCCLGVACKLFADTHPAGLAYPYVEFGAPRWLTSISIKFRIYTGKSLTELNDVDRFNFNEIADLLEAVYIHKVLE